METTPRINEILVWFWRFAGNSMTSHRLANCFMFVPRRRETLGRRQRTVVWMPKSTMTAGDVDGCCTGCWQSTAFGLWRLCICSESLLTHSLAPSCLFGRQRKSTVMSERFRNALQLTNRGERSTRRPQPAVRFMSSRPRRVNVGA